ncbi:MAG: SoxR reducing system RseC family protein, partial [Candidatus Omnitrophica bacterium]|nr:SoxR reducing system RseC family protein [Candidatus Omnitrophota bacterium]
MRETGVVLRLMDDSTAEVKIKKKSACNKCNLCRDTGHDFMVTRVLNTLGARPGDSVGLEISSAKTMAAAGLIFIVPVIALIAGLGLGDVLGRGYGLQKAEIHLISLISGIVFLGLAYACVHFFDV